MPLTFPYTHISCPCVNISSSSGHNQNLLSLFPPARISNSNGRTDNTEDDKEEEETFDPHSPRANYCLYPLDHLMYCEDCHQIRCPRCVLEEVVCWYCPSCLFEVPSSVVKAEGNKCLRSCFQCPMCTAPLGVAAIEPEASSTLMPPATSPGATPSGLWNLVCPHCDWNSREIGLELTKPNNITGQLAKLKELALSAKAEAQNKAETQAVTVGEDEEQVPVRRNPQAEIGDWLDQEKQFANLKAFYTSQLYQTASPGSTYDVSTPYSFTSPRTISRLVDLYTGITGQTLKELKGKKETMREAYEAKEGLRVLGDDKDLVRKLEQVGWEGSRFALPSHVYFRRSSADSSFCKAASTEQRTELNSSARFIS